MRLYLHRLYVANTRVGGELEAQSSYEEALNAVFNLQLTWRHMQPHRSRRDGNTKWSMIEMWPMHVWPLIAFSFSLQTCACQSNMVMMHGRCHGKSYL